MKKFLLLLYFAAFSALFSIAQKDTAFIYTFGGENDEQGRDIELTSDSGFIMVGSTSSFGAGNSDIYLVKVDSNIKYEWSAAIGHEFTEFGYAVKQTADNGYIICGHTNSIGNGSYDAYLVRTDDKGKLLWEKTFGGFDWEFAYDLEITSDGGFLIVGETHSLGEGNADAYLIRTDKDGNLLWEKTMGGAGKDIAHALISTKDGNFAFCGENASKNPENKGDAWLVKFDGNGDTLLDRTAQSSETSVSYDITEDKDKIYYCIGYTTAVNKPIEDVEIVSFSKDGLYRWSSFQGGVNLGSNNKDDRGQAIVADTSGNLFISGISESSGNGKKGMYIGQVQSSSRTNIGAPTFGDFKDEKGYSILKLNNRIISFGMTESYGKAYSDLYLVEIRENELTQDYIINTSEYEDSSKVSPNSITESVNTLGLAIYPSPIVANKPFSCQNCEILEIYDMNGFQVNFEKFNNQYFLRKPGFYVAVVNGNQDYKTIKLIVIHDN